LPAASHPPIRVSAVIAHFHCCIKNRQGAFIHWRGGAAVPFDDTNVTSAISGNVRIHTDLDVPVFILETQTDLIQLGYAAARQPDTSRTPVRLRGASDRSRPNPTVSRRNRRGGGPLRSGCPRPWNTASSSADLDAQFGRQPTDHVLGADLLATDDRMFLLSLSNLSPQLGSMTKSSSRSSPDPQWTREIQPVASHGMTTFNEAVPAQHLTQQFRPTALQGGGWHVSPLRSPGL
jgi:hypothetical protein